MILYKSFEHNAMFIDIEICMTAHGFHDIRTIINETVLSRGFL